MENPGMRREYENWGDKWLQNNMITESGIWEREKNKVQKWYIGYVLIYVNMGTGLGVIYFHEESIIKTKFCIFPDSHTKNIILYILLFSTLAYQKAPIFDFLARSQPLPKTFQRMI